MGASPMTHHQTQNTVGTAGFLLLSPQDTETWGRTLGALLRPGDVIALIGDLGAGKTTLTQAIARGMGIASPVTSPTFTLAHEYPGKIPLFHFDPYRLDAPEDLFGFGFEDYFERDGVIVVEWANKVMAALPDSRLELYLELLPDRHETRRLSVAALGQRPRSLLAALAAVPAIAALQSKEAAP